MSRGGGIADEDDELASAVVVAQAVQVFLKWAENWHKVHQKKR